MRAKCKGAMVRYDDQSHMCADLNSGKLANDILSYLPSAFSSIFPTLLMPTLEKRYHKSSLKSTDLACKIKVLNATISKISHPYLS